MLKRLLGIATLTVLLAGCGSGGGDHTPTAGTGGAPGGNGGGNPPSNPVYSLGTGSSSAFQSGAIGIAVANLSAGGSTSLTVSVVDQTGVLYTQPVEVSFNSACIGAGLASVTSPVSTSTGVATTTYVASGCSGADVITASTNASGQALIANGTVTVAPAAVGSIEFVSATPSNISLRGAGGPGRPETSTVVFRVRDSSNGPRAGATVNFSLQSSVNSGVTINPTSATSDAAGLVQTIVSAGTVSSTVSVSAVVQGTTPSIGTQSSPLTITTGIVDSNSISVAVQCFNVEGFTLDGTVVPVTVRMSDRFNNPVPDGTAVNFRTEGGSIGGQCVTATTANESGLCTVNWRSQDPRPTDGRTTLLASATGEESFTDVDANGIFSSVDSAWDDVGEPFLNENESTSGGAPTYDLGEPFLDFGGTPNVRDPGDGLFNGVLCQHPSLCASTTAVLVSASNLIIMSGSTAAIDLVDTNGTPVTPATITIGANAVQTVRIWVRDGRGNIMPSGTQVSATVTGVGLTLQGTTTHTVPCSNIAANQVQGGLTQFTFTLAASAGVGQGVLNIEVEAPSGVTTPFIIPVN